MAVISIGLFGLPGAGKSTVSKLLYQACENRGWDIVVLKLAEPLYDVQSYIDIKDDGYVLHPGKSI